MVSVVTFWVPPDILISPLAALGLSIVRWGFSYSPTSKAPLMITVPPGITCTAIASPASTFPDTNLTDTECQPADTPAMVPLYDMVPVPAPVFVQVIAAVVPSNCTAGFGIVDEDSGMSISKRTSPSPGTRCIVTGMTDRDDSDMYPSPVPSHMTSPEGTRALSPKTQYPCVKGPIISEDPVSAPNSFQLVSPYNRKPSSRANLGWASYS